jgi:hypothetical protein
MGVEQWQNFLDRVTAHKTSGFSRLAKCRLLPTTIRAGVLLIALAGFVSVVHAQSPMTIDFPGGGVQGAVGINNRGQIVGYSLNNTSFFSFLYEGGAFSSINVSGGLASGISDSGQIVGSYPVGLGGFLDNGGAVTRITDPSANVTGAGGISSNSAYIVGATGAGGLSLSSDGFLYTGGVFTTIDEPSFVGYTIPTGVNNSGQIVGIAGLFHGFLDNAGVFTLLDVPGAAYTRVNGINDYGTIVGSYAIVINTNTQSHGFVYNGGIFTSFDFPGATSTSALGINNHGDIVGSYTDAAGNYHGFFYPGGAQGYINTKYLIMGVTYAPPGGSASSVSYQNTNIVGNTSTITSSFTNSVNTSIGISEKAGIPGALDAKLTETFSGGWTQKTTNSNAITIQKTSSTILKTPGVPNVYSPVNHDYDIIWLWLNPVSVFTFPNASIGGPVVWNGYGYDLNDPLQDVDIWPVYVGYLNGDFGLLDAQDADALSRSWVKTQMFGPGQGPGITSSDFPNILKVDPFANNPYDANSGYVLALAPGTSPATSTDGRFTASSPNNASPQSIPYAQAPPNSPQGIQTTYQSAYQTQNQITQATTNTYMVGFGLELKSDASFFGLFGAGGDLKTSWSMTWDNTSQIQNTNTNTQTDTAVIASPPCPATTAPCNPQYTEPHEFALYQDNLYGTFMFWPNPYFSISKVAPATNTVAAGSAVSYTISTLANAGYSGSSISFNVTGLPVGASFNQGTVAPGSPFALIVSTTSATPTGSYPLTISATDGSQSYFAYATLVVTAPKTTSPTTTSLVSSLNPSVGGQSVTFTATVASTAGGMPTGTVTFFNGTTSLGTGGLNASAVATYVTTALAVGSQSITARYGGDTNYAATTSPVVIETVNSAGFAPAPTGLTVTAGNSLPINITLYATAGSGLNFALSCANLPLKSSCLFGQNPVAPAPPLTGTTVLLTFGTSSSMLPAGPSDRGPWPWGALGISAALVSLFLVGMNQFRLTPRRRLAFSMYLAVFVLGCALIGCAGGGTSSTSAYTGTPKGAATFTVTGVSGTTTISVPVTITVQ